MSQCTVCGQWHSETACPVVRSSRIAFDDHHKDRIMQRECEGLRLARTSNEAFGQLAAKTLSPAEPQEPEPEAAPAEDAEDE